MSKYVVLRGRRYFFFVKVVAHYLAEWRFSKENVHSGHVGHPDRVSKIVVFTLLGLFSRFFLNSEKFP